MATLLSIAKAVANDLGIAVPSKLFSNPEGTASALLRQATNAARRVYKEVDWAILQREHTFTTTASTAEYSLPSDFGRFIDETAWDRDNFWEMRGPLSPQQWQIAKSSLAQSVSLRKRWRVKRAASASSLKFVIDPTPSNSTDDLVFEYISKNWCESANSVLQSDWAADTDVPLIDAELIELDMTWRMLRRLKRDYADERRQADREIAQASSRDGGAPVLSVTSRGWVRPFPNVPDQGIGS